MSDNPFDVRTQAGETSSDPFSDPSVQQATAGGSGEPLNPFLNQSAGPIGGGTTMGFPDDDVSFPGEKTPGGGGSSSDPDWIAQRERELDAREAALNEREKRVGNGGDSQLGDANWPPCYPLGRNNITDDFINSTDPAVQANAGIMTLASRIMYANFFCLFWNFVCMCAYASSGPNNSDKFSAVILSVLFIIGGYPGTFYLWYRVLYMAALEHRASFYITSIGTMMISFLFWVIAAIGFPGTYLAGLWMALLQWGYVGGEGDNGGYEVTAIFSFVQFCLVFCLVLAEFWLMKQVWALYKGNGGQDAATADVGAELASNKHVQAAAIDAARRGVENKA